MKKTLMTRIGGFLNRLFQQPKGTDAISTKEAEPQHEPRHAATTREARPVQRTSDIPLELIDREYTPASTSSKASFRSDGSDHGRDQEFAFTSASDWNEEDRLTNKSGDPRIGTHGRNRQKNQEQRPESRE